MNTTEYSQYDAMGLAELVRSKQVSPRELLSLAEKQSQKWNEKLNAIVHFMWEEVDQQLSEIESDSAFYGVPFLLKDISANYKGHPTTGSCQVLKEFIADQDSELVKKYKKSGLVTFGKTNVPECGLKGVTDSKMRGHCRNPFHLDHTPGGSSGGAAAAVAAGIVPMAHGSDGGGSIRIPASCCGLVGLKPSRGRVPMGPSGGDGWMGFVSNHVLSKTVRDSALALDVTCGVDSGAPYASPDAPESYLNLVNQSKEKKVKPLRIAYSADSLFGKGTHSECKESLEKSVSFLQEMGHELVEAKPSFDRRQMAYAYMKIVASSLANDMNLISQELGRKIQSHEVELSTWVLSLIGKNLSAVDLAEATYHCRLAGRELGRFFEEYDLFMTPTMAYPPTKIGQWDFTSVEKLLMNFVKTVPSKPILMKVLEQVVEEQFEYCPNTELFNMTGVPAISLPMHVGSNNLPIGTQLVAAYGREDLLLETAAQVEGREGFKTPKLD